MTAGTPAWTRSQSPPSCWTQLTALALAVGLGTGCVHRAPPLDFSPLSPEVKAGERVQTPTGLLLLELLEPDTDKGTEASVAEALRRAGAQLAAWGRLHAPVHVQVLPTHAALEEAVHRPGYFWLRAWSRYDVVYLQSPATWGLFGAPQSQVNEVVLHELTHAVLFQSSGTDVDWAHKQIPLWFREGMASVIADQAYRWPSKERLTRFLEKHPGAELLRDADAHYRDDSDEVYGAAHHAFALLLQRYGREKVTALMQRMADGELFPNAFEAVYGRSADGFTAEVDHFLRQRVSRS